MNVEKDVLLKKLDSASKEQADLTVKVEQLEKEKKAGIFELRRLKRKVTKLKAERQKLHEDLSTTKTALTNTRQDQHRMENRLKQMEEQIKNK